MINALKLIRIATGVDGTFGVLIGNNYPVCLTLEEAWRDNKRYESCVPEGTYHCEKIMSPSFGITYELIEVPDRSNILFHWGNTEKDTAGCILVGKEYGIMKALDDQSGNSELQPAIFSSHNAFTDLIRKLRTSDSFQLHISWGIKRGSL